MMFLQASKGFKGKMEPQNTVLPEKLQKVGTTFSRVLKAAEGHNFSHTLGETCCYGVSMNYPLRAPVTSSWGGESLVVLPSETGPGWRK